MNHISRSTALKIAAVISLLLSVLSIPVTLSFLAQGANAVNTSPAGPPYFVEVILFVTSIVGVVAAYGTWKQMRWGITITILISCINLLSSGPGLLFAPRPVGLFASLVTVVLSILTIVFCLWRDPKPALA